MRRPMCILSVLFLLLIAAFVQIFSIIPQNYDRIPLLADQTGITVVGRVENLTVKEECIVCTLKHVSIPTEYDQGGLNGKYGLLIYFPAASEAAEATEQAGDAVKGTAGGAAGGMRADLLKIGATVSCSGTYCKFQAAENEGQFHTRKYYTCKGIDGFVSDPVILDVKDPVFGVSDALYRLREGIRGIFYAYLDEQDAAIMTALLLGDKGMLSSDVKTLYQNAGIAHILSLSGLHVAAIGLTLLKLLQMFFRKAFHKTTLCKDLSSGGRRSAIAAIAISGTILLCWCLMTGLATATIRAFVMFVLCAIADLAGRTYDLLSSAAFASIVTAVLNPLCIYDAGFQLSFGAVVSIGIFYPLFLKLLGKYGNHKILQGLVVSFSIQTGTLPIVAWHFYQVPLSGIVLNLAVIPLMSIVLGLGTALALSGGLFLGIKWALFTEMCRIEAFITHVILNFYEKSAGAASAIPNAILVIGRPKAAQILAFYAILGALGVWMRLEEKREEENLGRVSERVIDYSGRHNTVQQPLFCRVRKALILCTFLIIAHVIVNARQREAVEVRNVSVGQGDCTLIINSTCVILCDCGSSTKNEVGRYILIPCLKFNGIRRIDDLCISHFDSDHVNGILELLEDPVYGRKIKRILLSARAPETDGETENYSRFLSLTEEKGIPVYLMKTGDILSDGRMEMTCLSPSDSKNTHNVYEDTNATSLVLRIRETKTGFRMLLTGDIGEETEEKILSDLKAAGREELLAADYLKVAHHGSGFSSSQAFLQEVLNHTDVRADDIVNAGRFPRIAVISVGERNRYGHPHAETLQRLSAVQGLYCFRTDQAGEVLLRVTKKGIVCETFR